MNYYDFVNRISYLSKELQDGFNYMSAIPATIDYAEQRLYRELDLLATRVVDATKSLTTNQRTFTLSTASGNYLVVEQVNIFSPSTATAVTGSRVPLVNVSRDFLDITYPSNNAGQDFPEFWTMQDNATIILGPTPNSTYAIETVGTMRPTPLSSGNSSTFLATVLPDLLTAAAMIHLCNYLDGAAPPQDATTKSQYWETQYKTLMQSANVEEVRKKYQSQAWTSMNPSPVASPQRV